MFHLAVANRCNFALLHGLLLHEVSKRLLRVLCNKMSQLPGSSSAEMMCSPHKISEKLEAGLLPNTPLD
jgi:hypothetical protein